MAAPKITNSISPQEDFQDTAAYADYLAGIIARNLREMLWLLTGNLDVANIKAKSITADRMSVKELSAISADLGHITAGLIEAVTIIGSLIKTAETGQRVELSATENLLKAINGAGGSVSIKPYAGLGVPNVELDNGTDQASLYMALGNLTISTLGFPTGVTISSARQITFSPGGGYSVIIPSWNSLYSTGNGKTLQQELNDIWSYIFGLDSRVSALESAPPTGP